MERNKESSKGEKCKPFFVKIIAVIKMNVLLKINFLFQQAPFPTPKKQRMAKIVFKNYMGKKTFS